MGKRTHQRSLSSRRLLSGRFWLTLYPNPTAGHEHSSHFCPVCSNFVFRLPTVGGTLGFRLVERLHENRKSPAVRRLQNAATCSHPAPDVPRFQDRRPHRAELSSRIVVSPRQQGRRLRSSWSVRNFV